MYCVLIDGDWDEYEVERGGGGEDLGERYGSIWSEMLAISPT